MMQQETDRQTDRFQIPYTEKDGILYPSLIPEEIQQEQIGRYGRLRKRFLQEHRQGTYQSLLLSGQLTAHLQQTDHLAERFTEAIVTQLSKDTKTVRNLRSEDPKVWRSEMNRIKEKIHEAIMTMLVNI